MPIQKRANTDTVWPDFFDYFRRDFGREVYGWRHVLRYYGMLTPILLIALVALFIYVDPIPPKKAYLATGQVGSSYHQLSEKFAAFFKKRGFELELVETPGLDQGFVRLNDDKSPVNASFLTAGSANANDFPGLASLGSVQFSPIWLFYRGAALTGSDAAQQLVSLRTAIGMKGTTTQKILTQLLALHGITLDGLSNLKELPHQKAVEEFLNGQLDAVFIVDGIDAPNIQKLLAVPGVQIFNFSLVDAYVKKLDFLEKVVVPRGSIDIQTVFPANDTEMLSSTVTLLVEKSMHPVHQWLFLMAAREISSDRNQFFAKKGFFPAYLDQTIPLSPIAKQYYSTGLPAVFDYFPIILATLFDRAWVIVLTLLALVYPLFNALMNWRNFPSKKLMGDYYQDLRDIEEDITVAPSVEQLMHYKTELDELESSMVTKWYDEGDLGSYYSFRMTALRNVRLGLQARLKVLEDISP